MAFWQKKKGMIDVGKMAQRGMIRTHKVDESFSTTKDGFVEINSTLSNTPVAEKKESSGFFDFLGFNSAPKTETTTSPQFSTETNGYSKREVDVKIEELDNKIYKLEQRIELIERKVGIGSNW